MPIRAALVARKVLAILGLRHQHDFKLCFWLGAVEVEGDFESEVLLAVVMGMGMDVMIILSSPS